jgi:hypothetical protein
MHLCQARLKSAISSAMSLKFIQKMSIMATHHRNEEFQRIVVSHGTCLAVDAHFTVSIWGNSKSRSVQVYMRFNPRVSPLSMTLFSLLCSAGIMLQVSW